VGETTAGAENPVEHIALNETFVLKIPCHRTIYFGDRSGWERTGIKPDVEVPSDRALEAAHYHALRILKERLTDELAREKIQWGIDWYRAVLEHQEVNREVLESYRGRYGSTRILRDGNDLSLQVGDRPMQRLLPVASDYFVVEDRDDMRIRFVTEHGRVVGMERVYSDGYRSLAPRE
jgi:hypothetical protein